MASKIELAWAAGMIDADGCITMTAFSDAFRKPLVVVDNTDVEILNELVRLFDGSLVKKKRYQEHHRQAWSWRLYGAHNVRSLLSLIYPYMRCAMKKERARMLLEDYPRLTPRNGRYTSIMREGKIEFEAKFMALGAGRGSRSLTG